jgi:MFS family permease
LKKARLGAFILSFLTIYLTSIKHVWTVFIPYVEKEFMVPRTISVLPFSLLNIANVIGFLTLDFFIRVMGRRALIALSGLSMFLGLLLASLSGSMSVLVVSFAFIYGIGNSFGYVLAVSAGISQVGRGKSGTVTGVLVSAYTLGIMTLSPLTTFLIAAFGSWRQPLLIYGVLSLTVTLPLALSVKKRNSEEQAKLSREVLSLEILKSREFLFLAFSLFLTTLLDGLIAGNLVPLAEEVGCVDAVVASLVVSVYSAFGLLSRLVIGKMSEHISPLRIMVSIYLIAAVDAFLFPLYKGLAGVLAVASMSAVLFSANVTLSPILARPLWGMRNFEAAYGYLLSAIVMGVLVGPLIGGISRDLTGHYYVGIALTAITTVLGSILMLIFMRYLENSGKSGAVLRGD